MTKFTVVGAGMAGLFAAAVLRDECLQVLEAQKELPNNHSALLRFRSSVVGDALNIPFQEVDVIKTVVGTGNPVADAVAYSIKTNGHARLRSVLTANGKLEKRYIAPNDFILGLYNKVQAPIEFGRGWRQGVDPTPIISTVPMPIAMGLLGYKEIPEFSSTPGFSIVVKLRLTDLCATVYFPRDSIQAYRASITHDTLIVEHAQLHEGHLKEFIDDITRHPKQMQIYLRTILEHFGIPPQFINGIPELKPQKYAKILPIDDNTRKRFMLWATEKHNVYSFGRFATWRPGLLMDDLVNDLQVIQKLANGGTSYDARK